MPTTKVKGYDIETVTFEQKVETAVTNGAVKDDVVNISGDTMTGTLHVPSIDMTTVDPADAATLFGTDDGGVSIFHIRIGNGAEDKIQFESWNGSSATSLMEIDQTTVNIKGNLVVNGTTTTVNSQTLDVADNEIRLNSGVTGAPAVDAGIVVERGAESDAVLKWNETTNEWQAGTESALAPIVTILANPANARFYSGDTDPTDDTRINYNGYFYATRVYNAVYNDLAEFIYAEEESQPGDVLCWNEEGVKKSDKRARKDVIGVHSDTFGYALGADNKEDKVPIGLAGRVKVRLAGKVKKGDELVSYKDGKAIKANLFERVFKRSTIIGKALENGKKNDRIWMLIG